MSELALFKTALPFFLMLFVSSRIFLTLVTYYKLSTASLFFLLMELWVSYPHVESADHNHSFPLALLLWCHSMQHHPEPTNQFLWTVGVIFIHLLQGPSQSWLKEIAKNSLALLKWMPLDIFFLIHIHGYTFKNAFNTGLYFYIHIVVALFFL